MFTRNVPITLRQRLTAWLALWSLVLGALLPVLSHAAVRAPQPGQGWVEVCTVSGMAWVRQAPEAAVSDDGSQPPAQGGVGMAMPGCVWCATHAPALGLPPVAALEPLPLVGARWVPDAFLQAPRLLAVWATAHSRAPPSSI
jgi:hypothetical protein